MFDDPKARRGQSPTYWLALWWCLGLYIACRAWFHQPPATEVVPRGYSYHFGDLSQQGYAEALRIPARSLSSVPPPRGYVLMDRTYSSSSIAQ
ncbi:hypothetical protein WOLCODRAFT_155027 [Wolfiporia cocos MD-104 SS10]|uniref:Uncharacterized protein n=1 Tax=Wolfiporia cocos (strain MD-104) TaxID=742152 RepID=A0A2H3K1F3_WOLCO|nr:hypothetical protein WOLCODRAFT_155027 [Wolfiporia cocos MD-104 SS10]